MNQLKFQDSEVHRGVCSTQVSGVDWSGSPYML